VFTSPTTVDVEEDTNASEIIYTATTNDDTVAYTLKGGDQKEKFTINNTTSELKYKDKQTQVGKCWFSWFDCANFYRYSNKLLCLIACNISGNNSNFVITYLSLFVLIL
jgi:hypothetical protein